jgi:hypothetical protein
VPKTKTTDPALPLADPASERVVLAFVEGSARNVDAPARALTAADIARLAYQEAARRGLADGIRPDPHTPDQAIAGELVEALLRSGLYVNADEAAPAADESTPAQPATTTEG